MIKNFLLKISLWQLGLSILTRLGISTHYSLTKVAIEMLGFFLIGSSKIGWTIKISQRLKRKHVFIKRGLKLMHSIDASLNLCNLHWKHWHGGPLSLYSCHTVIKRKMSKLRTFSYKEANQICNLQWKMTHLNEI